MQSFCYEVDKKHPNKINGCQQRYNNNWKYRSQLFYLFYWLCTDCRACTANVAILLFISFVRSVGRFVHCLDIRTFFAILSLSDIFPPVSLICLLSQLFSIVRWFIALALIILWKLVIFLFFSGLLVGNWEKKILLVFAVAITHLGAR